MIIGLVGPSLSGKDFFVRTILELAQGKSVAVVSTGKLLKQTLDLWGILGTRKNYSKLVEIMCTAYGEDVFSKVIFREIEKVAGAHDAVIVNALRLLPDVPMIRCFPWNIIVAITADAEVCFQRTNDRREKAGEGSQTFEEFLEERQAYTEHAIDLISRYVAVPPLTNNSTREEFREQIMQLYAHKIGPILHRGC